MMHLIGTKTAALATGTVLAVGFAAWNVTRTIGGGRVLASAGQGATGASVAGKPRAAGVSAVEAANAHPVKPRPVVAPLEVAPDADPFTELAVPGQAPSAVSRPGAQNAGPPSPSLQPGPGPVVRVGPVPPPLPGANPFNRANHVPVLPDAGTRPVAAEPVRTAAPVHEPQVVGTMLGDVASAVFSVGEKVIVARVGDTLGDWKVIAISHSRVLLRYLPTGKELTLRVSDAEAAAAEPSANGASVPSVPADSPLPPRP